MLLYGIIDELKRSKARTDLLSYFFCQAADERIDNATAVLRGLVYLLIDQQPSLVSHIRKKHDHVGKKLFEDANAWEALTEIFTSILQDPSLDSTYVIIDALDECVRDLPKLLNFIIQTSVSPRVKWIVSSRNWPEIEKALEPVTQKMRLCLELNEKTVSAAVTTYIEVKVDRLAKRNGYDNDTRDAVQRYLSLNANGTFLWVALVCQELAYISRWNAQKKLTAFPPGLDALYGRMMDHISRNRDPEDAELCKRILAVVSVVRRPVTLDELASFVDMPDGVSGNYEDLSEILRCCGSFLTLRERTIFFIHQSAKDFLLEKASDKIFSSGKESVHHHIVSRSLQVMSRTLQRDVYSLSDPGFPIDLVKQPDPDPLAASRYSCTYWVDHLCDWTPNSRTNHMVDLQDRGVVDVFLRKNYLYWLEALSLCRNMSAGVISMAKLEALIQGRTDASALIELVRDAHRFIKYHKWAIENTPLQAYASALVFSPACSLIKSLFKKEEPKWITIKPVVDKWNTCLQTLEDHKTWVASVTFSHDSARLASASGDRTVKIWDASSGKCLQTLDGHNDVVTSVIFLQDLSRLASASRDKTVKIWDIINNKCLQTLEGHDGQVFSIAFSHDSARSHDSSRLASASSDQTIKIWDMSSGRCLQTLRGHDDWVNSVTFSHDSSRLASASRDKTVKIWDMSSGRCLHTLKGHEHWVHSVAFLHNSSQLASASSDETIKFWDIYSSECLQTLKGHNGQVFSIAFSHDLSRLVSASSDNTVKIWDVGSDRCLQTLKGHSNSVSSVAFSYDSFRLASASSDKTVKIWDTSDSEPLQTLNGHSSRVDSVAFSHDSMRLASMAYDQTIKLWDINSGECLQTLKGHKGWVYSVAFSYNAARLASASLDSTVKIWDINSGECLRTLKDHKDCVRSVAFSHDSAWLASALDDCTVKIWDTSSGKCLKTLEGHSRPIDSVAFSHDSARLASASSDHIVKTWDASSGKCLQTLDIGKPVFTISFDTTGSYLRTDFGTIAVDTPSAMTPTVTDPQKPLYLGGALGSDGVWITYNSKNLVWLPSEYRPSSSAVSGKTIGVGTGSGKVWICNFEVDASRKFSEAIM